MKKLYLVAMFCLGVAIGIFVWQVAKYDPCPLYYHVTCIPK